MAKECKATFFCKLTRASLISFWIFYFSLVLTNTKPLHFGQWQNTICVILVNKSNTIGVLIVNWFKTNYEDFAKHTSPCFNHLQKLYHLFSIRHQRHVVAFSSVINYNWRKYSTDLQKKCGLTLFSYLLFALTESKS